MKITYKISTICIAIVIIISCSSIKTDLNEKYQPLGSAVLTANDLLMVKYYENGPDEIPGSEYKLLLKEDYKTMYERLLLYKIKVLKVDDNYKVSLYDDNQLILTDWICTQNRIDCWSYNGECDPDTLRINCD